MNFGGQDFRRRRFELFDSEVVRYNRLGNAVLMTEPVHLRPMRAPGRHRRAQVRQVADSGSRPDTQSSPNSFPSVSRVAVFNALNPTMLGGVDVATDDSRKAVGLRIVDRIFSKRFQRAVTLPQVTNSLVR